VHALDAALRCSNDEPYLSDGQSRDTSKKELTAAYSKLAELARLKLTG